ncbi:(2Fe-2S)-binding protein [Paenibacillus hamazuiensis]|uniref:(2Fe-2S)-binding protein n=1 Tax=Paenibacillus hamazuiensis TaxID=2936508 RepID=UPI00200D5CFE|nr:(2Fe-2S)-binding protein [Paenibacillus hamazuiensis]
MAQPGLIYWKSEVNGVETVLSVSPSLRLIDLLRDKLELTGPKLSCGIGRCGACMVLLDGKPVNACLVMAYQCSGKRITTVEGISGQELHPIQQAFLTEGGFQCGYCTPGMIVTLKALLDENPSPSRGELEAGLCGNLCRCTGYGGIERAVRQFVKARSGTEPTTSGELAAGMDAH